MTLLRVLAIAAAVAIAGPAVAKKTNVQSPLTTGPTFDLSGNQEVPSISTAGNGTLVLEDVGGGVVNYTLTYQDLEGTAVQAHIHFGQRGFGSRGKMSLGSQIPFTSTAYGP